MKEDSKKIMEFVKIPIEFFKIKELNITDCAVLSVYKYFTEEGYYHCCTLTNEQICDILNICLKTLTDAKRKLTRLGFIERKGIKVRYLGVENTTEADTTKVKDKEDKTEKPQKPTMTIDYMSNKSLLFAYFYEEEYKTKK